jgi:hypothetical protein
LSSREEFCKGQGYNHLQLQHYILHLDSPSRKLLALDKQIKKIKNPCSILSGLPFLTHYVIMNHGFLSQPQMAYELLFFVVVLFYVCFIFGGTGV